MCLVEVDVDEYPKLFSEHTITARGKHRCGECGKIINPGEQYERASGIWEGKFLTMKTCLVCLELRKQFCCSYIYGHVLDDIRNALFDLGDIDLGCLDGLSPQAVAVIAKMIDDLWEDEEMPR